MRRSLITLLAVFAALVLAGVALASFTQTASTQLTARHGGRSTGIVADLLASDPTAVGARPRSVRTLRIAFPAGTRFDLGTSLAKACRLTDKQLMTPFGPTCPRRSRIGHGSVVANAAPLQASVTENVVAYVSGSRRLILVLKPTLSGAPVEVVHGTISGPQLTLHFPRVVWGKLIVVVLASLKLQVPSLGTGSSALITAGRCTQRRFVVREHFVYADHGALDLRSSSPCR